MDNIDVDADPPVLGNRMYCTVCEMVCPEGAIDVNMAAVKKDRGETKEEIYAKGQELQKIFEERQKKLRPEKRLRYHIDPKDIFTEGYVSDETEHPRLVIPTQGWSDREKIIP